MDLIAVVTGSGSGIGRPITIDHQGRAKFKELEVATSAPLRHAVAAGIERQIINDVDPDLVTYDLMLLAHGWALKGWHFGPKYTVDAFIAAQTALMLNSLLTTSHRGRCRRLLTD